MTSTLEPRSATKLAVVRAAIYTRQSVERAGDQALTSVQAQRAMVEAYVASQAGQGWRPLPTAYDDEGYSGATLSRPAFQRLLADVKARLIDVVVTYRMDRLSRSQRDFLNVLHLFDEHGVKWVSATEAFSTARPEGRAMLSVLMAFAQMEREVTAGRVRDKLGLLREAGAWTGGVPPLGYDSLKSRLMVNEREAERVRGIFELYLRLQSIADLTGEVEARGWTQKRWTNGRGKLVGGSPFDRHALRRLLTNTLYVGQIRGLDGALHPAQHTPIVPPSLWEPVQTVLAAAKPEKPQRRKQSWSSLLGGLLYCGCGAGMSHHYTSRHGRRYSYYVCQKVYRQNAAACPGSRVRADELDAYVVGRLRTMGRDRALVAAVAEAAREQAPRGDALNEDELRRVLAELMPLWDVMHLAERQRVLHLLLERVRYVAAAHDLFFDLRDSGVRALSLELADHAATSPHQ